MNCETDIDECSMEPCHNNGTCFSFLIFTKHLYSKSKIIFFSLLYTILFFDITSTFVFFLFFFTFLGAVVTTGALEDGEAFVGRLKYSLNFFFFNSVHGLFGKQVAGERAFRFFFSSASCRRARLAFCAGDGEWIS